jgi:hypothetical protein
MKRLRRKDDGVEPAFTECDWCKKLIRYGHTSVTIQRNIEQVDLRDRRSVATVIQSDVALTLCTNCGSKLRANQLRRILSRGAGLGVLERISEQRPVSRPFCLTEEKLDKEKLKSKTPRRRSKHGRSHQTSVKRAR